MRILLTVIKPNWHAPKQVKSFASTRIFGQSSFPFQYANLGQHVGDTIDHVKQNRSDLVVGQNMPDEPQWLNQTHSTNVVDTGTSNDRNADASITRDSKQVLAILTADCLPILITNKNGTEIGAIHAGWRGLCDGIIENALAKMQSDPYQCMAWIGPSICAHCFEVGEEVPQQFIARYDFAHRYCFFNGKWHINLPKLATHILRANGIFSITDSKMCTFEQKNLFFSYRRDGQTGRIGTFIWFE